MDRDFDLVDALGGLLTLESGKSITDVLAHGTDSLAEIAQALDTQNKILVKILIALKKSESTQVDGQ